MFFHRFLILGILGHTVMTLPHFYLTILNVAGSAGRPKIIIEREQLQFLINNGYTGVQIADNC